MIRSYCFFLKLIPLNNLCKRETIHKLQFIMKINLFEIIFKIITKILKLSDGDIKEVFNKIIFV